MCLVKNKRQILKIGGEVYENGDQETRHDMWQRSLKWLLYVLT